MQSNDCTLLRPIQPCDHSDTKSHHHSDQHSCPVDRGTHITILFPNFNIRKEYKMQRRSRQQLIILCNERNKLPVKLLYTSIGMSKNIVLNVKKMNSSHFQKMFVKKEPEKAPRKQIMCVIPVYIAFMHQSRHCYDIALQFCVYYSTILSLFITQVLGSHSLQYLLTKL